MSSNVELHNVMIYEFAIIFTCSMLILHIAPNNISTKDRLIMSLGIATFALIILTLSFFMIASPSQKNNNVCMNKYTYIPNRRIENKYNKF